MTVNPTATVERPLGDRTAPLPQGGVKYLSARNWFFLALKVFGYNLLGYFLIALPILLILFLIGQAQS